MPQLSEDAQDRYDQIRRTLAAILARWREREELTLRQMSDRTDINESRIRGALLAEWRPSIKDLARLDVALDLELRVDIN